MKAKQLFLASAVSAIVAVGFATMASAATGGPTVVLTSTEQTQTSSTAIPITATFSEPVTGLSTAGITATNGSVTNFAGSGSNYTFDLAPSSAGTATVMIPADMSSSTASGTGNQDSNTLTFDFTPAASSSPTTAPVISNVTVTAIDPTDATISWSTDAAASSQVVYGTSPFYGAMTTETDLGGATSHSQELFGLTPGTLYHFYVTSNDSGGTATSSDMTFTTAGSGSPTSGSSTPLAITGIDTIQSSAIADGTFADGWQWVLHFSVPSGENFFSMKFGDFTQTSGSAGTIPAASNIMFYSPQSTNASSAASAFTETNNDYTGFLDLATTSSADQDVDVYVDVAVPSGTPTGTYSTTFGALSTTTATTTP